MYINVSIQICFLVVQYSLNVMLINKVCQHLNFTHLRNPLTVTLMHTLYTLPVVNMPQKLWRVKHECNMQVLPDPLPA